MATQLEFFISLNSVDVSESIYRATIVETREKTKKRPTAANATSSTRAGSASAELVLEFEDELDPSTSKAHQELADALRSDSGECPFVITFKTGDVSVSNPQYSGTIVVTELATGGEVGTELDQTQTFPITADGVTIATSTQ